MKRLLKSVLIGLYIGVTGCWIAWDLWHQYVLDWRWCR